MPPGMASPRSSELASPTRRVSPWPHGSRICSGGAVAHSLSKCACLPPRHLGGSAPWLSTPSFGMPIRLDLYAPSEPSYIRLRSPSRWRSSCPIPFVTSPPTPASPPTSSVTAIPSATSAPPCPAVWVPSRVFSSSGITRMMASPAPSLSKIGRLAARLRVMRVLAASPKSGWSAPIVSVATPSSCYASGECSSRSASPSAPPTRTSTIPSTSISTPSSPPMSAASSSNAPPRA